MSRRSVAVLNSSGIRIEYTTYRLAEAAVDEGRAVRESARCIRLVASSDPVQWRKKPSGGRGGPLFWQIERRQSSNDDIP